VRRCAGTTTESLVPGGQALARQDVQRRRLRFTRAHGPGALRKAIEVTTIPQVAVPDEAFARVNRPAGLQVS
jgi:hypothetical protein